MDEIPGWVREGLPQPNAWTTLSRAQTLWSALLIAAVACAFLLWPGQTFLWLNTAFIVLYLVFSHYKLFLQFLSIGQEPGTPLPEGASAFHWPAYTIMVPLYREAAALPGLIDHLAGLDYPTDKLQILLLVEEDDEETRAVLERRAPGPPFEVTVVPASQPRTKPKACDWGLRHARGELLVIYDAEDRPERDQLKKAALCFSQASEDVVCLQARLDFYNPQRNLITRLFTAEYASWFGLCLPGLHMLDAPIPLGGTSNHFKLCVLRRLRGWDPFNVTEDCDLGVRLYLQGYRTLPLDSTTWEEAAFRLWPWVRQRSRWFKGYLQTYLVHMRQQGALFRRGGIHSLFHFQMIFGANCFCLLMNPFYWVLTAGWLATRSEFVSSFYPLWVLIPALLSFLAGNAAFVLSTMIACVERKHYWLVPLCLLTPFYWVLMSLGAWKGALQLVTQPFYWEKTPHEGAAFLEDGT